MNENQLLSQYREFIENLLTINEKLVFLVGAGISIDPPASLLPATQFINLLIDLCSPKEEIEELLSIESLRYEMIAEIIQRYIDYDLEFMNYFESITYPNLNHIFLGLSITHGHAVYTTNFDYLIEFALKLILVEEKIPQIVPIITEEDFKQYQSPKETFQKGKFPIYKLHGAKRNVITKVKTTNSLITTMSAFGKGNKFLSLEPYKKSSFLGACENKTLIVLGYSGRDDFDIAPILRQLHGVNRILWIDHNQNEKIEIFQFNPKLAFVIPKGLSRTERLLAEISSNTDAEVFFVKTNTGKLIKNTFWSLFFPNIEQSSFFSPEIEVKPPSFKTFLDEKFTQIPEILKWKCTSDIYLELGLINNFLRCVEIGLEKSRNVNSTRMEAEFLNLLGIYHYNQKQYDSALKFYEIALEIDKKTNNIQFQAVRLNNIGLIYLEMDNLDEALNNFNQALDIAKGRGDFRGIASRTGNIGLVFFKQKNFERALEKYQEALIFDKKIGNLAGRSIRLKNIGDVYKAQKKYAEALEYYRNSYQIIQKLEDRVGLGKILTDIGFLYSELKDYGKAITNLKKAITYLKEIDDKVNLEEAKNALKEVKKNLN